MNKTFIKLCVLILLLSLFHANAVRRSQGHIILYDRVIPFTIVLGLIYIISDNEKDNFSLKHNVNDEKLFKFEGQNSPKFKSFLINKKLSNSFSSFYSNSYSEGIGNFDNKINIDSVGLSWHVNKQSKIDFSYKSFQVNNLSSFSNVNLEFNYQF